MTLVPHKMMGKGYGYYELVDEKWVNGKAVQKYAGYLGKSSLLRYSSVLPSYASGLPEPLL